MSKKNSIDPDSVKSISTTAAEHGVPERWLRNRISAGKIASVRVGWNLFVPVSEATKIRKLAAQREK